MTRKGSVNAVLLAAIAVLLVGGGLAGYFLFLKPPATGSDWNASENAAVEEIQDAVNICSSDSECISVNDGCCGCGALGTATAINGKYASYWKEKTAKSCRGITCADMLSGHWTCSAKPKCVRGACRLVR